MISRLMSVVVMTVFCRASPKIRDPFDATVNNPLPPTDPFYSFNENPTKITRMDMDDMFQPEFLPKKVEKSPLQKKTSRFGNDQPIPDYMPGDYKTLMSQPGVVPKLTGSATEWNSPNNFEYFQFGENDGVAVVNPAATYLNGGSFEKIPTPKCRLIGCSGPFPNDGTLSVTTPAQAHKVCQRSFVPLNGCTNDKGYPMGMLCSICCECSGGFINEMKNTYGFKIGYNT